MLITIKAEAKIKEHVHVHARVSSVVNKLMTLV